MHKHRIDMQARLDAVWKSTPDSVKEEYGESFFREGDAC